MKLSDIMGHMDLATFPEIALVIFLVVFAAIGLRVLRPSPERRAALDEAARLPLDDATPSPTTQRSVVP